MVNKSTKQKILELLKDSPSLISGEEISARLGISRVAVWKQIKSLTQQGYPVHSGPKGYSLDSSGDCLSRLEFSEEEEILYYDELGSTMDEAVRQIQIQGPETRSFLVLAEHQSAGMGRDNSPWDSPSGGIYLTFVLKENMPLNRAVELKNTGILTALMALENLGISREDLSCTTGGDILLQNSKVGGILEEYQVRGGEILWFALGMGIHLNDSPPQGLSSVKSRYNGELNRVALIRDLKKIWNKLLKSPAGDSSDDLTLQHSDYKIVGN